MKIVFTKKEFEDQYYYKNTEIPANCYPTHYPCVVIQEHVDCGLGGSTVMHHVLYPGKHDINSYVAGFKAARKLQ